MAVLATEKILTLDYWKAAYQLQPGDYIFDRKGNLVKVTVVQEFQSEHCYEVMLDDYLTISGNDKLEFPTENVKYRLRAMTYKGVQKFKRPLRPVSVAELLELPLKTKTNRTIYSIPTCDPLKLPTQPLSIPPFVFGFWFFNRLGENRFSCKRDMFEELQSVFINNGYIAEKGVSPNIQYRGFKLTPSVESQLKPNIPYMIPLNYLMASPEQRTELLKGIIAARSTRYSEKNNRFTIYHQNINLFKQIQYLVESLGIRTYLMYDERYKTNGITFKSQEKLAPNQKEEKKKVHPGRRYIQKLTPIRPQACVHIETDGPDGTFLVGEGFIACR